MKHWHQFRREYYEDPEDLEEHDEEEDLDGMYPSIGRVTFLRQRRQTLDGTKYFLDGFEDKKVGDGFSRGNEAIP